MHIQLITHSTLTNGTQYLNEDLHTWARNKHFYMYNVVIYDGYEGSITWHCTEKLILRFWNFRSFLAGQKAWGNKQEMKFFPFSNGHSVDTRNS